MSRLGLLAALMALALPAWAEDQLGADDLVLLVEGGLPGETVLAQARMMGAQPRFTAAQLIRLKKAKASPALIRALIGLGTRPSTPTPARTTAAVRPAEPRETYAGPHPALSDWYHGDRRWAGGVPFAGGWPYVPYHRGVYLVGPGYHFFSGTVYPTYGYAPYGWVGTQTIHELHVLKKARELGFVVRPIRD